jgi:hypothetical protein
MKIIKIICNILSIAFSPLLAMNADKILQNRLDILLFEAADKRKHADIVDQIKLDVDLYEAIGYGNVECAKRLLEAGARIGQATRDLYAPHTPLILCVQSPAPNIGIFQLLLDYGAPIDEPAPSSGQTALMVAAIQGSKNTCKLLLDKGADLLARDSSHNTVLLLVAKKFTDARKFYAKKPIGGLWYRKPDPIVIDHMTDLKETGQFLVAYQEHQERNMFTLLACLKYNELSQLRELYRRRNTLLVKYLHQYLVKSLLEAKNDEGKSINDYE